MSNRELRQRFILNALLLMLLRIRCVLLSQRAKYSPGDDIQPIRLSRHGQRRRYRDAARDIRRKVHETAGRWSAEHGGDPRISYRETAMHIRGRESADLFGIQRQRLHTHLQDEWLVESVQVQTVFLPVPGRRGMLVKRPRLAFKILNFACLVRGQLLSYSI